jgi:peptidoglycan/xylan/chitin deacetylase (PgdA/CDA1 family)
MKRSCHILFAFLALATTTCKQEKHQAGLCLSFDDRYVKEWYQMRGLFNQYKAHVTFFVSQFDSLSVDEIKMLHELQNDGHEIASHGAMHVQAESCIKEHSYKEYIAHEIDPSIASMKKEGFDPVSFAYPYGSKYWFTDYLLLKKFNCTRGVASLMNKASLKEVDDIFYNFNGNRKLFSFGIDTPSNLSHEAIIEAMERATLKNEVLLLNGHVPIQSSTPPTYSFDIKLLEFILKEAEQRHLVFYRFRDLSADQN